MSKRYVLITRTGTDQCLSSTFDRDISSDIILHFYFAFPSALVRTWYYVYKHVCTYITKVVTHTLKRGMKETTHLSKVQKMQNLDSGTLTQRLHQHSDQQ